MRKRKRERRKGKRIPNLDAEFISRLCGLFSNPDHLSNQVEIHAAAHSSLLSLDSNVQPTVRLVSEIYSMVLSH